MSNNSRATAIALFLIITVLIIAASYFIHIFRLEERRMMPASTPERAPVNAQAPSNYEIPANAVPTPREIEENIGKAENQRKEVEAMHAELERERIKRSLEPSAETQEETAKEAGETKKSDSTSPSRHKKVVFPTQEERKNMEERGIFCY